VIKRYHDPSTPYERAPFPSFLGQLERWLEEVTAWNGEGQG
jgi:hypothetical protein